MSFKMGMVCYKNKLVTILPFFENEGISWETAGPHLQVLDQRQQCPQTPTDLGWHLEDWQQISVCLLCQHRRFMGEKEVTARYLPSTQLVIRNAGGEGSKGIKKQSYQMKWTQSHEGRHDIHPLEEESWGRRRPIWSRMLGEVGCGAAGSTGRPRRQDSGKNRWGRYGVGRKWGTPNTGHITGGPSKPKRLDLRERVSSSQRLAGGEQNENKVFHKAQSMSKTVLYCEITSFLHFGAKMFSFIKSWRR